METDLVLPEGWFFPDDAEHDDGAMMWAEFLREIPSQHRLSDVSLELVAVLPASDDILVRHRDEVDVFSSVHLTGLGRTELPGHPRVEFTGPYAGFMAWQMRLLGC